MESDVAQTVSLYKLWGWFETNKKQVALGAAGVVLAGLVIWFFVWKHDETELAAGKAFSAITVTQLTTPGPHTGAVEAYLKVAADYPSSGAGTRALLLAAGTLFADGKYDLARAQFQRFTRDHRDSPLLGEALLGLASCLDSEGKTAEATTAYKEFIDHHPNEVGVPQAKFALARLYQAQNRPKEAHALYTDVEKTDPYGSLAPEAGMRIEEIQAKNPELAPKAPQAPAAQAPAVQPLKIEKAK